MTTIDPKTIRIPPEVVEAAAMQLPGMAGHQRYVRAAIAAALAAWEGAKEEWRDGFRFDPLPHGTVFRYAVLILPLPPQEEQ